MRRDIQFLRGLAVLVVVIYHSNLNILSQGYLGVDIFFVISGFLITSIILKGLDNNNFSFSEFYLRRAKRLLPALYSTLVFTTLLGLFVLTNQQWTDYLSQLQGALTFTANMVLPTQTGYFDSSAEGKPLLHIWSLSLEEQYYFLLPISLFILPRKFRLAAVVAFAVISFYWCISWVYSENQESPFLWRIAEASKSEWAFYLLFTRAWELLAGSICAFIMMGQHQIKVPAFLKLIALLTLIASCIVSINDDHPGIESLVVVVSTMIILLGNTEWLPNNTVCRSIEKVGDWSYSVYLVHWPLFAFLYLSYAGAPPGVAKLSVILLSFALGYAQFRYVEQTFRDGRFKKLFSNWKLTTATTAILLALPTMASFSFSDSTDQFSHIRRTNFGIGKECGDGSFDKENKLKSGCLLGEVPKIVIWGDSYAMHLVPGLSVSNKGLVQITKSACGPIPGISPVIGGKYGIAWSKECLAFNDNAMAYIEQNPTITHVVMSSVLEQYLNFENGSLYTDRGKVKSNKEIILDSLRDTISKLETLGIKPIIISPPPRAGFDIGECLERTYSTSLLLKGNCEINHKEYLNNQKEVNNLLTEIQSFSRVLWLKDYLCKNDVCKVYQNGVFIYRDNGHLSVEGSTKTLGNIQIEGL